MEPRFQHVIPDSHNWKRVEITDAPARRWQIVRAWVEKNITKEPA